VPIIGDLRIGFLTYGLDRPVSGISRYALELGRALVPRQDTTPFFLTPYIHGPFTGNGYVGAAMPGTRLLPSLMTLGALELPVIARKYSLPLIHDPTGVSPFLVGRALGGYKRVVTLHDAIAFRYPEGYSRLNNFLHRVYVPLTLSNVDAVVTPSESARQDLSYFLRIPLSKIEVIPEAADAAFRPLPSKAALAVAASYGLTPPFVLSVGALQARKDLPTLLRAIALVRRDHPRLTLAIVGRPFWRYAALPRLVERLGLEGAVRFTGHVPEADLPYLYNAANVFCLPSLYEGFGLPVLEAMACGTPVVCSTTPALLEVAGDAALSVDPRDHDALAEAIVRIIADQNLAPELAGRGLARAAYFSWERAAEQTVRVYQRVLAHA
jgi:glycosyltransferase involved in cell wall biosynthesis